MKIACLISGLPRSFQHNIKMIKNIFGENTDYFLHVTDNFKDKYNNSSTNYTKIVEELKPVLIITEKDIDFEITKFKNIKKQWYKINIINNIRINYEKINGIKYDIIIRIRPDLFILDDYINFHNVEDGIIYGKNDEIFYGNSNTFNKVSDLIYDFDKSSKNVVNVTDFFFNYLKDQNIKFVNIDLKYKLILTECNIIAISGDSGCGKTTLIENLDKIFKANTLKIEGDRYHKWERGDPNWEKYTHLNPEANYICKFREDTFNLKFGENIYQVDYDHSTGKFTDKKEIISAKNILMCGLHTLYDDNTNKMFNLKIFVDTDKNLKYFWKIKRDILKRGYTIDQVLDNIKKRESDNVQFIEPQKKKSDIIIKFFTDNNFDYKNISDSPNIYLKISSKKNILKFLKILDKYNIEYNILKENNLSSIIFYKVYNDFKSILFEYIKEETNMSNNDYYTIIIAFIIFINNEIK